MVTVVQAAPTLSVTPANRDVSNAAGVTTFAITSNSSWTISSDAGWCTGPASGTGDSTAIFAYTQNTTITVRVRTLTVTTANCTCAGYSDTGCRCFTTIVSEPIKSECYRD